MAEMQRGVVKWFNDAKGYGFIVHQTGQDVFVHYSVIDDNGFKTLKDGEEVNYELREGDKGLNASRVIRVNKPAQSEKAAAEQGAVPTPAIETSEANAENQPVSEMIEVVKEIDTDSKEETLVSEASQADIALRESAES